ncbi:hypothetical protein LINPERHAP2_LOCUS24301 [Linum perenne]
MASVSRAAMETLDQLARGSFVVDHEGSTPSGNTPPTLHPSDMAGPSSVMPHIAAAYIALDMGKGSITDLAATLGPLFLLMVTKEYADLYDLPKEVNLNPGRRSLREILQPDVSARRADREAREARAATGRALIELGYREGSARAHREAVESYVDALEEAAREATAREAAVMEAAADGSFVVEDFKQAAFEAMDRVARRAARRPLPTAVRPGSKQASKDQGSKEGIKQE